MERPALRSPTLSLLGVSSGVILALVVSIAALADPGPAAAPAARWPTYFDPVYGFAFHYPPGYRVRYFGPNLSMRRLMAGEQISGTVPPSNQTIGFTRPRAPGFHVIVFGQPAQISPEMVAAGQCGSQFARRTLINRIVRIAGLRALERRQLWIGERIGIDYCFGSGGNYLITLRAQGIGPADVRLVDRLFRTMLSTIRLFPPRR